VAGKARSAREQGIAVIDAGKLTMLETV